MAVVMLAAVVTGCGGAVDGSSAAPPSVGRSASPSATVPSAPPTGSPVPSVTPSSAASPGTGVRLDEGLLAILPGAVDGAPVQSEALGFEEAVRDPGLVANVEAAVIPVVVDGADLASGIVARLRPGVASEAFLRDWRDAYDAGACAQAGGVTGRAESTIGTRSVDITSCAGGLRVYHAYLPERDVVVSLFSLGERRFGERLMEGLRP